jgi:hypothetical protein
VCARARVCGCVRACVCVTKLFLWVIDFGFMETYGEVGALTRKILTSVSLVPVAIR